MECSLLPLTAPNQAMEEAGMGSRGTTDQVDLRVRYLQLAPGTAIASYGSVNANIEIATVRFSDQWCWGRPRPAI